MRGDKEADARAEALLLEHLDERQAVCWRDHGFVPVTGASGAEYVVYQGTVKGPEGSYCLQPERSVPDADSVLARVLWIEADEEAFLKTANFFPKVTRDEARRYDMERRLAEEQRYHQRVIMDLHQDFQMQLTDEEHRFAERVAEIRERFASDRREFAYLDNLNCSFEIGVREGRCS